MNDLITLTCWRVQCPRVRKRVCKLRLLRKK